MEKLFRNSAFPGSVLYDLFSKRASHPFNSWSVSVRQMWNLPMNFRKYVIEPFGGQHAWPSPCSGMIYRRVLLLLLQFSLCSKVPFVSFRKNQTSRFSLAMRRSRRFHGALTGHHTSLQISNHHSAQSSSNLRHLCYILRVRTHHGQR